MASKNIVQYVIVRGDLKWPTGALIGKHSFFSGIFVFVFVFFLLLNHSISCLFLMFVFVFHELFHFHIFLISIFPHSCSHVLSHSLIFVFLKISKDKDVMQPWRQLQRLLPNRIHWITWLNLDQ